MTTAEVIKRIKECKRTKITDIAPHQEVANAIAGAANSKLEYVREGFQLEAEGEDPTVAPPSVVAPIF